MSEGGGERESVSEGESDRKREREREKANRAHNELAIMGEWAGPPFSCCMGSDGSGG